MRVRMNVDYSYCPDGIHPKALRANDVEDAPDHIARVWLAEGKAREDKMAGPAPEFKWPQRGSQGMGGPPVKIEVLQGASPYEVPPPGVVHKKPVLARKVKR